MSGLYEAKGLPGEVVETHTIILHKDWMKSPDVISKTVEHHVGTRPDINRTGELKFFENNKELDPNDPNLWDKVDSTAWKEAYDKSGEGMPNYIKDLYKASDRYPGENQNSFKITLDKDWRNSLIIVDDNLSRPSRKSKQRNWLFRRISKIMHKAQVFLVKRKTKV